MMPFIKTQVLFLSGCLSTPSLDALFIFLRNFLLIFFGKKWHKLMILDLRE